MILLSVILPVHNQADIIIPVFSPIYKTINKTTNSFEVILIENGSVDTTFDRLKRIKKKFRNTKIFRSDTGYGNAILKGLKHTKGKYVLYMPSDGQVDNSRIPILLRMINQGSYHLVKVRRNSRENISRFITSKILSISLAFFFKTPLIDVNGSPRILRASDMKKLNLTSGDSFIDSEMLIKMTGRKWLIKEINMKHIDRYGGKSTRSIRTYFEFIINILKYRISSR